MFVISPAVAVWSLNDCPTLAKLGIGLSLQPRSRAALRPSPHRQAVHSRRVLPPSMQIRVSNFRKAGAANLSCIWMMLEATSPPLNTVLKALSSGALSSNLTPGSGSSLESPNSTAKKSRTRSCPAGHVSASTGCDPGSEPEKSLSPWSLSCDSPGWLCDRTSGAGVPDPLSLCTNFQNSCTVSWFATGGSARVKNSSSVSSVPSPASSSPSAAVAFLFRLRPLAVLRYSLRPA